MILPRKNPVMLLTELYDKSSTFDRFSIQIMLSDTKQLLWRSEAKRPPTKSSSLLILKNVPNYMSVNFEGNAKFKCKKFASIKGYAINTANHSNIDEFLKEQLTNKAKKEIIRRLTRLEKCFDIRYEQYFGKIDEAHCSVLLESLKKMIVKRFQQRNQKNDALKNWDHIKKTLYSWIISKKASLYVIYNNTSPLAISIGYHYGDVYFSYVTSYDIDYYKFGLGNIMVYKKVEMCLANNYRFLDMGWGELDYKHRWCNHIHDLGNYVLFPRNSLLAPLMAVWEGNKTRLKYYLTSLKIVKFIKDRFLARKPIVKIEKDYDLIDHESIRMVDNYIQVDLKSRENSYLSVIYNDFIYGTQEYYLDVTIYKSKNDARFFLQGKNHCKQIVFRESNA